MKVTSLIAIATLATSGLCWGSIDVSFSTQFNCLGESMPSSFSIGQEVSFDIAVNEMAPGTNYDGELYHENAVTNFEMRVLGAGFNFASDYGDIQYLADSGQLWIYAAPFETKMLDGFEFLGVQVGFEQSEKSVVYQEPLRHLNLFVYSEFELFFVDPSTGRQTSGSILTGNSPSGLSDINFDLGNMTELDLSGLLDSGFSLEWIIPANGALIEPIQAIPEPRAIAILVALLPMILLARRRRASRA